MRLLPRSAFATILLGCVICAGCNQRAPRDQYGDIFSDKDPTPQWLMAKLELPHTAPDGSTPAQVRDRYLGKIKAGDAEAAAESLELVRAVIQKEGGLFTHELAQVATEALRVRPDAEFVRLLIRQLPNENVFLYRSPDAPGFEGPCSLTSGTGQSLRVLGDLPNLAVPELLTALADKSIDDYHAYVFLEAIKSVQRNKWVLPWEEGRKILSLYGRYPKDLAVQAGIESVMYELYQANCKSSVASPNLNYFEMGLRIAEGGQIDDAWGFLCEALEYSRLQVKVVEQMAADGVRGVFFAGLSVDLLRDEIRIDLQCNPDRVVSPTFRHVRDVKASLSLTAGQTPPAPCIVRATKMPSPGEGWRVHLVLEDDPGVTLDFTCKQIAFPEPPRDH